MLKLINEVETAMRNLRQVCIDRDIKPTISITYYGDDIESCPQIYLINVPGKLGTYESNFSFETFIEEIFLTPSKEEQRCKLRDHQKRNQLKIDLMEKEEEEKPEPFSIEVSISEL